MAIERIQLRRGTASQWTDTDPILGAAEIGVELGTPNKFKIGDGSSTWSELDYFTVGAAVDAIPTSEKGASNGVATLDANSAIPISQLANIIDSAPETLNTLNELAAALADDANFATTVTSQLSGKSDVGHTHTKSEITDFTHTHTKSEITDFSHTHTKSEITDFDHNHTISEVINLDGTITTIENRLDTLETAPDPTPPEASPTVRGIVFGQTGENDQTIPTALGHDALVSDQMAGGFLIGNIGVGDSAGLSTTTGGSNVFMGVQAGVNNTTGANNTIIGTQSWTRSQTGNYNTIIGNANQYLGAFGSGDSNNVMVGSQININRNNATSSNCIIIGHEAEQSSTSVANQITLGNTSISSLRCNVTSITSLSDERDKTNIQQLDQGLSFVKQLNPVKFEWDTRDGAKVGVKDFGFIAQDLVKLEDSIDGHDWLNLTLRDNPEKLEATQGRLIPILVQAIKDLSENVETLQARIEELENG